MARNRSRGRPAVSTMQVNEATTVAGSIGENVPDVYGVSDQELSDPQTFNEAVNKGAYFGQIDIPTQAPAGDTFTITGKLAMDIPVIGDIIPRAGRVRIESPALGEPIIEKLGKIDSGNAKTFSISVPTPAEPGGQMAITAKAQRKPPFPGSSWQGDEIHGPVRINILSGSDFQRQNALSYAPYVAGGAGIAAAASSFSGRGDITTAALAGAAAGAGGKVFLDQTSTGLGFDLSFPTYEVAAIGAAAFGVAFLLNTSGADEVLQPVGSAAGSAVRGAGRVVERGRQAIQSDRSQPGNARERPALPPADQ